MSYDDPTYIKKHAIKISLDDHVNEIIESIVAKTGAQKSVIARRLLIEGIEQFEKHEAKIREKPG